MRRLLLLIVLVPCVGGCQYARKWMASEEIPSNARLASDDDRRSHSESIRREMSPSSSEKTRSPVAAEDGSIERVSAESGAGEPPEARGRWDRLLEAFGRPRRIPLPRTDVDSEARPVSGTPDFGA